MWTTERPTEAGWYWYRTVGADDEPLLLKELPSGLGYIWMSASNGEQVTYVDEMYGEWQPVPPPQD